MIVLVFMLKVHPLTRCQRVNPNANGSRWSARHLEFLSKCGMRAANRLWRYGMRMWGGSMRGVPEGCRSARWSGGEAGAEVYGTYGTYGTYGS